MFWRRKTKEKVPLLEAERKDRADTPPRCRSLVSAIKKPDLWKSFGALSSAVAITVLEATGSIPNYSDDDEWSNWWIFLPVSASLISLYVGWQYLRGGFATVYRAISCSQPHLDMDILVTLSCLSILSYSPLAFFEVIENQKIHYKALLYTLAALKGSGYAKDLINARIHRETQDTLSQLRERRCRNATLVKGANQYVIPVNSIHSREEHCRAFRIMLEKPRDEMLKANSIYLYPSLHPDDFCLYSILNLETKKPLEGNITEMEIHLCGEQGTLSQAISRRNPDLLSDELKEKIEEFTQYQKFTFSDHYLVGKNDFFPVDAELSESRRIEDGMLFTGEETPRSMSAGETVYAGTSNVGDPVLIRALCAGDASFLHTLIKKIQEKQRNKRTTLTKRIDQVISYFVPFVIVSALATFGAWWLLDDVITGIKRMIKVFLGACPCTIGIANESPFSIGRHASFKKGLLFVHESSIEAILKVTCFVFDKTGTLAHLQLDQDSIHYVEKKYSERILSWVSAAEKKRLELYPTDPFAPAVLNAAKRSRVDIPSAEKIIAHEFNGIVIDVEEEDESYTIAVGNMDFLKKQGIENIKPSKEESDEMEVYVAVNGEHAATLPFQQILKEEAQTLITQLRSAGYKLLMLTGDQEESTKGIAEALQIDYMAGLSPAQKEAEIKRLQEEEKQNVAYVGDGVNDTLALTQANVGISVGIKSAASGNADIISSELRDIGKAHKAAKGITRAHKQGVGFSLTYNITMMLLSAVLFPVFKIRMPTVVPGVAMAASSLLVLLRSFFLISTINRTFKDPAEKKDDALSLRDLKAEVRIDVKESSEETKGCCKSRCFC